MIVPGIVRVARLQALMAWQLTNWREAWGAYRSGGPLTELRFRNGGVLHSRPHDGAGFLFFEVFANGCYRRGLPRTLSGAVIDVGANVGAFTLDMAMRFPGVVVHAYEPDPDTFAVLLRNVEANGLTSRVRAWNEAVAGVDGTVELFRGEAAVLTSAYLPAAERSARHAVPSVSLSTVAARCGGRIDLLKLDCEGAEADILENAGQSIAGVARVVTEYHDWLVPDVVARLQRVLDPHFAVDVTSGTRCGPMLRAVRR